MNAHNVIEFQPFPKIARLTRECIITEKIDGTNASIIITDDGQIAAASRTRIITPGKSTDNFGFAGWVQDNKEELLKLGPGRHFGEWWGAGIQRTYGRTDKVFSLFNVSKWSDPDARPRCCRVVPTLYRGEFSTLASDQWIRTLAEYGSYAEPGFMNPEGIVIYHVASGTLFKKTIEADAEPKSRKAA